MLLRLLLRLYYGPFYGLWFRYQEYFLSRWVSVPMMMSGWTLWIMLIMSGFLPFADLKLTLTNLSGLLLSLFCLLALVGVEAWVGWKVLVEVWGLESKEPFVMISISDELYPDLIPNKSKDTLL